MRQIKYSLLRQNSKPPSRANPADAGMDVFFCPDLEENGKCKSISGNFLVKTWGGITILNYSLKPEPRNQEVKNITEASYSLFPGENALFPTGLKLEIPEGFVAMVCNRGSVAAKRNLVCGAHIVDSGYSGEIFVDLHNVGLTCEKISPGDKIAQILLIPVFTPELLEVSVGDLYKEIEVNSSRGDGNLGSTGK